MSKDLTRRTNLTRSELAKPTKGRQTEVDAAKKALAERMLFGPSARPQQAGSPRIILVMDCTTSIGEFIEPRKILPERASTIANDLFAGAGSAGLQVQLVYFRGDDKYPKQRRQFHVSDKWYTTPEELTRAIIAVEHWPGWTQHCAALRHAVVEAENQAVEYVVVISDAFEGPNGDDLVAARVHAARLRDLGVKLVVGYKGTIEFACPMNRAGKHAERDFLDIARANGGYCFLCNPAGDPEQLGERFRVIGEQVRLRAQGDAAGAQKLIEHLQTIPFEMTVGERVPSPRCASEANESEE
jgi:hypothetical protein